MFAPKKKKAMVFTSVRHFLPGSEAAPMRDQFNSLKALADCCATSVDLANAIQTTCSNSNGGCNIAMNVDPDYNQNQVADGCE
jgi:hypothetical protein